MKKNSFKVAAGALAVVIALSSTGNVAFAAEPGTENSGESSNGGYTFSIPLRELFNMAEEKAAAEQAAAEPGTENSGESSNGSFSMSISDMMAAVDEKEAAEKAAAEQAAAEKAAAEQAAAEKAAAEQAAAEKAAAEQAAAEKAAAEQAAAEKAAAEETVETKEVAAATPAPTTETKEAVAAAESVVETAASAGISNSPITFGILSPLKTFCFGTIRELFEMASNALKEPVSDTVEDSASDTVEDSASDTVKEPVYVTKSHYHCNCGYNTYDYTDLKMHMFQHALNGDRNSYSTTYEKVLQP